MPSSTSGELSSKPNGVEPAEHIESDADRTQKAKRLEDQLAESQRKCDRLELTLRELDNKSHKYKVDLQASQAEVKRLKELGTKDKESVLALQAEVRRMQELDFTTRKTEYVESHDTISRQLLDVFELSKNWARDYFRISINSFRLDDHELFKKHLSEVLWDNSDWAKKKKLNVSHLVEAVVANLLAKRILLSPFAGCADSFRNELSQLHEVMLKQNKPQAHKLRAAALTAYERCGKWPPSSEPIEVSRYREDYYKEVAKEIDLIVGPIAQKHFPEKNNYDERFRRSMSFIEAAGKLAIMLGKQAAELGIMDKSWFESTNREFICDDEKMKGRFMEEDEESEEGFRVDIILRPGFLKYGNDDGENFEKCAVWIPAMLDLRELGDTETEIDTQESPELPAPEKDITVPGKDITMPGKDITMPDALPELLPVGPSQEEPVENGLPHQQQRDLVEPSPEVIKSEPQPGLHQPTPEKPAAHKEDPAAGPVRADGENPVIESSQARHKRKRDQFRNLVKRIKPRIFR